MNSLSRRGGRRRCRVFCRVREQSCGIAEAKPHVVCLQELKAQDEKFRERSYLGFWRVQTGRRGHQKMVAGSRIGLALGGLFSSISLAVGPIISACRASSSGLPPMIVEWARSTAISANPAVARTPRIYRRNAGDTGEWGRAQPERRTIATGRSGLPRS